MIFFVSYFSVHQVFFVALRRSFSGIFFKFLNPFIPNAPLRFSDVFKDRERVQYSENNWVKKNSVIKSMFINVAALIYYNQLFLGVFRTSYQQSNFEWLHLISLIFFLEISNSSSFSFEVISFVIWQRIIFKSMTLKNNQFSLKKQFSQH